MIIVGAGMAGLLAGHYFDKHNPTIIEKQKSLPNNHEALLRFRTDKVARLTGIDFQKVRVRKAIRHLDQFYNACDPFLANTYSRKVTDEVLERSIWDLAPVDRFVAPGDFIARAAAGLRIGYSSDIFDYDFVQRQSEPIISTIPMPVLMDLVGWKTKPDFKWKPIWSIQAQVVEPCLNVYQTIYYPSPGFDVYRASITGNRLIIECLDDPPVDDTVARVAYDFGIRPCKLDKVTVKRQEYGKIIPVDPDTCRDFIYTMTQEHNIYSLGRFATWRQLLMDDIVDDCAVIEKLIKAEARRSGYHNSIDIARATSPHSSIRGTEK